MKICKKCKEVISWGFDDLDKGCKSPKQVNIKSIKLNLCKECFEKIVTI